MNQFANMGFKFEIIFCLKFLYFIPTIYVNQALFGYKKSIGTKINERICLFVFIRNQVNFVVPKVRVDSKALLRLEKGLKCQ